MPGRAGGSPIRALVGPPEACAFLCWRVVRASMAEPDLVVIGAGALGAATAWHAARLGADVVLLDRGGVASGTSARGAGVVNRLLWNPLDVALVARSIGHLRALADDTPRAFRYHPVGGLTLLGEHQLPAARRSLRAWRALGLAVAELEPDEVGELPGCAPLAVGEDERGLFLGGDGYAITTDAVRAMVAAAEASGAQVRTGTTVREVRSGVVALEDGALLETANIVVAAGAWTPALLPGPWQAPLGVYRPQACLLSVPHELGQPTVHDAVRGTYWRSEGPGKLLVGNGTVLAPHVPEGEPRVEPRFAPSVKEKVAARWPVAARASLVRAWAGFEAGTPDRRPLAGPVPGQSGIWVLAGGNGFGFMRAPALGEAIACQVLDEPAPVPLAEYAPARFPGDGAPFALREGFSL